MQAIPPNQPKAGNLSTLTILTLILGLLVWFPVAAQERESPRKLSSIRFEFQVVLAELEKPLRALEAQYTKQLRRVEEDLANAGKSAEAGIIRKEIESFQTGEVEIPRTLTEARRLRGIYERERLPLIRTRNRLGTPIFQRYQAELAGLQASLAGGGNKLGAEQASRELKSLEEIRSEWLAAAVPGGREETGPVPVFVEDFENGVLGERWEMRQGQPVIDSGWLKTPDNGTEIATSLETRTGDQIRIEFQVEKQGDSHHSEWDFEISLGDFTGSILFDDEGEDRLALNVNGQISRDSFHGNSRNKGTATLVAKDGKVQFGFTSQSGRTLRSEWITAEIPGKSELKIRLAGGGEDSPRLIDNIRFFRECGPESGDSEHAKLSSL